MIFHYEATFASFPKSEFADWLETHNTEPV